MLMTKFDISITALIARQHWDISDLHSSLDGGVSLLASMLCTEELSPEHSHFKREKNGTSTTSSV